MKFSKRRNCECPTICAVFAAGDRRTAGIPQGGTPRAWRNGIPTWNKRAASCWTTCTPSSLLDHGSPAQGDHAEPGRGSPPSVNEFREIKRGAASARGAQTRQTLSRGPRHLRLPHAGGLARRREDGRGAGRFRRHHGHTDIGKPSYCDVQRTWRPCRKALKETPNLPLLGLHERRHPKIGGDSPPPQRSRENGIEPGLVTSETGNPDRRAHAPDAEPDHRFDGRRLP